MSFSIAATISRLFAPRHELSCSWFLWRRLAAHLCERGRRETRESGAFLLGFQEPGQPAWIVDFILYDDLDPHSLDTGIIRFDGRHFGKLWAICRERRLTVVADVHASGRLGAKRVRQGASDGDAGGPYRTHHAALRARAPIRCEEIGIYRYLGNQAWQTVTRAQRRVFLHIGL